MSVINPSIIVIISEIALALYPVLIKTIPTDIQTQIFSRLLTYSVLGFSLASTTDITNTWLNPFAAIESTLLGLITLLHVGASYLAFQELPAGIAMSIFYTYPILNLIVGVLGFGESINLLQMFLIFVCFIGAVIVSYSSSSNSIEDIKEYNYKGLLAAATAALTETIMYFAVKMTPIAAATTPFQSIIQLYPAAFVALIPGLIYFKKSIDFRPSIWTPMLIFNIFVGFVGYVLRFYSIPRLSTLVFSFLAFIGVIASFGWGWLFVNEVPSLTSLFGASLITGAVGLSTSSFAK